MYKFGIEGMLYKEQHQFVSVDILAVPFFLPPVWSQIQLWLR